MPPMLHEEHVGCYFPADIAVAGCLPADPLKEVHEVAHALIGLDFVWAELKPDANKLLPRRRTNSSHPDLSAAASLRP